MILSYGSIVVIYVCNENHHNSKEEFEEQRTLRLAKKEKYETCSNGDTLIFNAMLPSTLWGETLLIVCHVRNRIACREIMFRLRSCGKEESNSGLFTSTGCLSFYKVTDSMRTKLRSKGLKVFS